MSVLFGLMEIWAKKKGKPGPCKALNERLRFKIIHVFFSFPAISQQTSSPRLTKILRFLTALTDFCAIMFIDLFIFRCPL